MFAGGNFFPCNRSQYALYYGVFHMKTLITGIQTFLGILTPIVYGVVIAFLLTPVLNFLEKKIIYPLLARKEVSVGKKGRKAIRWACVILCMFLFLALIYALIMMILPELIRSIMGLIYSFPAYVKVIQKWLQSFIEKWNLNSDALDTLNQSITTARNCDYEYPSADAGNAKNISQVCLN